MAGIVCIIWESSFCQMICMSKISVPNVDPMSLVQVVVYKILYIVLFLFCVVLYQVSDINDLPGILQLTLFSVCGN